MKIFTTLNADLKKGLFCCFLLFAVSANAQVLINENFNATNAFTPPGGWTNVSNNAGMDPWDFNDICDYFSNAFDAGSTAMAGNIAIMNTECSEENANADLITSAFDASMSGTYYLDFDNSISNNISQLCEVDVWNGSAWINIMTVNGASDGEFSANHKNFNITAAAGGFTQAKVRFHYSGNYEYWWAIDNVKITRVDCIPPTATFSLIPDCANGQFSVNANVSNMGDATSLSLSDGTTTYGGPITTTGTYTAGPFASGAAPVVTLIHSNTLCNVSQILTHDCPPVNDNCANALSVPVGAGVATTAVVSTTVLSTVENNMAGTSCGNIPFGGTPAFQNDIWFTVMIPPSGNVIIQSSALSLSGTDVVMGAYSGSCGNLTFISCNNDGNPDDYPSSEHSRIGLTGQTPGATIYIRITPFNANYYGPVAVTAWDPVQPMVATSGTCTAAPAITINAASGNLYRWVPIVDATGKLIAEIHPRGNTLGVVNTGIFINSGAVRQANGVYYLDRNIAISPAVQPNNGNNVDVKLYILQSELNALMAMDPAVTSISNLNISKSQEGCQSAVNAATAQLTQSSSSTFVDGASVNAGIVQFSTPSFSSFYLRGGSTPLPVVLRSVTASNIGAINRVDWQTASETSVGYFELEKSADGKTFSFLSRIAGNGKASSYSYNDRKPFFGDNYYRLKLIEKDGRPRYSTTVKATVNESNRFALEAYPNPTDKVVKVKVYGSENGNLFITDISGKVVLQTAMYGSESDIDFSKMASGVYFIRYTDGKFSKTIKVSRQ